MTLAVTLTFKVDLISILFFRIPFLSSSFETCFKTQMLSALIVIRNGRTFLSVYYGALCHRDLVFLALVLISFCLNHLPSY